MCHSTEYAHMEEDAQAHAPECEATPEQDRVLLPESERTIGQSPWVKRCLDYAQFPQARGSEYEG